jgi:hypothetical protein
VAGDGVSTETYGTHGFFGTSAAAPHVAGAAAVLSSATVSSGLFTFAWSPADFLRLLQVRSRDFGVAGPDNTYGWGGIVLPPASSDPADFATVTAFPNPFNAGITIEFAGTPGTPYELRVFDLLGRTVWHTAGTHVAQGPERVTWDGRDQGGRTLPSSVYFYRVNSGPQSGRGKAVLLK